MSNDLNDFLAPRVEEVKLGTVTLTVRELPSSADTQAFRDPTDSIYKWVVRCVFDADGKQVWTDDDIERLKVSPQKKMAPLLLAVAKVNGWDMEGDVGNSGAVPSSG